MKLFQVTCREAYNFWKARPLKFGRAKYTSETRFPTYFDFDREYLWYGSTGRKSEKKLDQRFHVGRKNGRTLVHKQKVLGTHIDQPMWTFLGDYISAIRGCCGCCPADFLHDLDNTNNKIYLPEVRLS